MGKVGYDVGDGWLRMCIAMQYNTIFFNLLFNKFSFIDFFNINIFISFIYHGMNWIIELMIYFYFFYSAKQAQQLTSPKIRHSITTLLPILHPFKQPHPTPIKSKQTNKQTKYNDMSLIYYSNKSSFIDFISFTRMVHCCHYFEHSLHYSPTHSLHYTL